MSIAINKVLVAGAGIMGSGIARVCAKAGCDVFLYDSFAGVAEKAVGKIRASLEKRAAQGKMAQDEVEALVARITPVNAVAEVAAADLVIEAVVEELAVKQELFADCEKRFGDTAILASNTSSILISEIAGKLDKPERVIGMHFFNPVPAMKLVEVINGLKTSAETTAAALAFVERLGKVGVRVKDSPGFLVNRINNALKNEAYACLAEGVASIEDIDKAMKLGLGHPMGPFELNDMTGLDIGVLIAEVLYGHFREPRWKPFLPLKKLVMSGEYGIKTGKGWYDYTSGEKKPRDLNI